MKTIIVGFILGVSLIILPSAFAIEEMTNSVMKKTTGRGSISVGVDNVVIENMSLKMLYIDNDGITGTPADAAGVRMSVAARDITYRAIFDYTDRGGYLQREYGTFMRREAVNGGVEHWAGLSIGGDSKPSELTIGISKKLKLHSYMKAFNNRADGIREAKLSYNKLSSLALNYSGDLSTNINAIIAATGMAPNAALSVYSAARGYADMKADPTNITLANEVGTRVAYANSSVSGIEITLPTLELRVGYSTVTFGVEAEGSMNNGTEYIRVNRDGSVMAILGGHVEICAN